MMPPSSGGGAGGGAAGAKRRHPQQPPLTVTGVAPWAMKSPAATGGSVGGATKKPPSSRTPPSSASLSSSALPPALPSSKHSRAGGRLPPPSAQNGAGSSLRQIGEDEDDTDEGNDLEEGEHDTGSARGGALVNGSAASVSIEEGEDEEEEAEGRGKGEGGGEEGNSEESPGLARVRRYMDELKPPRTDGDDSDENGISSWARAQMSESPVLLPSLKFHDLVFGRTLGTGAFGTVKYARRIVRDRTRSRWPEFAVKVVSTSKIEELGYERSISREIAILRTMTHPGVARLVSSFRFRDGAYLVLEYGSGGDLHGLLRRVGSLDVDSAKFVVGEVVAALGSIHDAGFVYGDLKPENLLITESGHVKLTDFGGCRAVSDDAKEALRSAMGGTKKNLLQTMRNGDWREKPKKEKAPTDESTMMMIDSNDSNWSEASAENDNQEDKEEVNEEDEEEEDHRVEGTTAYLPPEVVLGNVPTIPADSWALGCVLYQCLSGRPPLLEDTDTLTAQKIVTFELSNGDSTGADGNGNSSFDDDDFFCRIRRRRRQHVLSV